MSRPFREPPAPEYGGKSLVALMVTGFCSAFGLSTGIAIERDPSADFGFGSILFLGLSGFAALVIPLFGMPKLHRWAIGWYWVLSLSVLVMHPIAMMICVVELLRLISVSPRDAYHTYQPLIFLAASAPGLWFLWKLVRDPWWQPWRRQP